MTCQNNGDQINLVRGITYDATVRWEDSHITYKQITGIDQAAPALIHCPGHGVPPGWRVAIVSVKGMNQINAQNDPPKKSDYHKATYVSSDSISLNDVNAANYSAYKSSGYVQFNTPVDMTDFTARMQIRASLNSDDVLDEFTTEDSRLPATGLVIDNSNKTITLNIAASVTEAYTFTNAVYSLEMVSPDGVVTRIATGDVVCSEDVTR